MELHTLKTNCLKVVNIANVEKNKKKGDNRIGGFMVLAEGEFNQL
jgi:hypothetical protein